MWTLYICTSGWIMCGQIIYIDYQTEPQCYRAMNELYMRQSKKDFKYVACGLKGSFKKDRP